MTVPTDIDRLIRQARDDLAAFGDEFNEKVADINLRLQRLEYAIADSNRRIVEQGRTG